MTGYGIDMNRRRLIIHFVAASLSHTILHPSIPPQISCSSVIENIPEISESFTENDEICRRESKI